MKKAIVFIAILALSYAALHETGIPGSWSTFKFSNGFQNDPSAPLTKVYNKLTLELKQQGIENIQFINASSQVVNGMNFKIEFSYTKGGATKKGNCFAYVSFSGETCEINAVNLQQDHKILAAGRGGWSSYPVPKGFEQDTSSPLYMVYTQLSKELSEMKIKFMKFETVQSQMVSGLKFNIRFNYVQSNGEASVGTCIAVVREWENFVEIEELSVKSLSTPISGGWNHYTIEPNFQSNTSSPLNQAYVELAKNLKKSGMELTKLNDVQSQIVNGINFKINFSYKKDGKEMTGDCKVYVSFIEKNASLKELQLHQEVMQASQSVEGGWKNYEFNMQELSNESSPFTLAFKKLNQTLEKKNMKLSAINSVKAQVVSGNNFKVNFVYRENGALKIGQATIYVQTWTNTVEITQFELQGKPVEY